jgi:D-alanyl-D-alanine carboxypeptidase (penicillin-binding protein 5/6)
LLEQSTGKVLLEQNADEPLPPASITKVMTLLLIMEALDSGKISLEDVVTASEYACSMGGSQIWLKVGEEMSVGDLLKAVAIASANDASVALGEFIAGSNDAFVQMMNDRAEEFGMANTVFKNCNGLDEEGHITTARDVAIMSRELLKHPLIKDYSTVWMDTLRGGLTQLVNTNRLVRFYNGCTGLKTGTTSGAGSCLSATAERDGLGLVAVVMGSPTSDERFAGARGLLDYGFANFAAIDPPAAELTDRTLKVLGGVSPTVAVKADTPERIVVPKGQEELITVEVTLAENVAAPVVEGQTLGQANVMLEDEVMTTLKFKAAVAVDEKTLANAFSTFWNNLFKN